jgi:gliding motility associated protien GldN
MNWKHVWTFGLLTAIAIGLCGEAIAQKKTTKKAPPKKTNTKTTVVAPPAPVDTPKVAVAPVEKDTIPLRTVLPGRRPSTTVLGNLVRDKTPIAYDHIRIDDQLYRQVIWREIDTREKMNLPFRYEADESNGNQRFFNIILKHIKEGDLTAFNNVDDRFTTPIGTDSIASMLAGKKYIVQKLDFEKDPDGSKGIFKDTTIRDEFDENSITAYRVKEEVVFDRETSRLHFRVLGIAPVKTIKNDDGSVRDSYPLFWLYYPEMRPLLAKYEAYNPRNIGQRMSWEEIFESRYFASYIYKSTLNNPFDKPLAAYIPDPLMRLLEGDAIKETIFNWEQNQWSY